MGPLDLIAPGAPDRWGREPDINAFVELHNLVAAAEAASDLEPDAAARIGRERGVDLQTAFRDERLGVYVRLFDDVRATTGLTESALRRLGYAARTLALVPADVRAVHTAAFGTAVEDALADDCLTIEERLHLYGLQQRLGLDETEASQTVERQAQQHLLTTVARVLCDGQLTPDEAAEVARAVEALGVGLPDAVAAMLNRAASRWEATAPLPVLSTGVPLEPGETAHAEAEAVWWSLSQAALETGISAERLAGDTAARTLPHLPGTPRAGTAVLTARRLVLVDAAGPSRSVPLGRLVAVLPFLDGFVMRIEASAKRLVLRVGPGAAAFETVLHRLRTAAGHLPAVSHDEVRWAFGTPETVRSRLAGALSGRQAGAPVAWGPPGTAEVVGGRLVLRSWKETRHVRLGTLTHIARAGRVLTLTLGDRASLHLACADDGAAAALASHLEARP